MKKSTDLDVKHWDWTMDINARGHGIYQKNFQITWLMVVI